MTTPAVNAELAEQLLGQPYNELTPIQRSVIDMIGAERPSGLDPDLCKDDRTYWQRLADRVAEIGGSWPFIFSFLAILIGWMGVNLAMRQSAFDPYPFIFLNLMLSTLAALQAPVIMMSQNRQAAKDRQAAENDYVVNLRAELEIMHLHDKIDRIRMGELMKQVRANSQALARLEKALAR